MSNRKNLSPVPTDWFEVSNEYKTQKEFGSSEARLGCVREKSRI
jgi:hypothetical protein